MCRSMTVQWAGQFIDEDSEERVTSQMQEKAKLMKLLHRKWKTVKP